jgi:hypothetical protein
MELHIETQHCITCGVKKMCRYRFVLSGCLLVLTLSLIFLLSQSLHNSSASQKSCILTLGAHHSCLVFRRYIIQISARESSKLAEFPQSHKANTPRFSPSSPSILVDRCGTCGANPKYWYSFPVVSAHVVIHVVYWQTRIVACLKSSAKFKDDSCKYTTLFPLKWKEFSHR